MSETSAGRYAANFSAVGKMRCSISIVGKLKTKPEQQLHAQNGEQSSLQLSSAGLCDVEISAFPFPLSTAYALSLQGMQLIANIIQASRKTIIFIAANIYKDLLRTMLAT